MKSRWTGCQAGRDSERMIIFCFKPAKLGGCFKQAGAFTDIKLTVEQTLRGLDQADKTEWHFELMKKFSICIMLSQMI